MAEFTEEELAAAAVTADDIAIEPPAETQQDRPRDEAGRFAPNQDEQQVEERANGKVPHQALHAEREGHKQTKVQLQAAQEQLRTIAEMRARIAAQSQQQEVPPAADDPAETDYLRKRIEELGQRVQQRDQRDQHQEVTQQENQLLFGQLNSAEAEFRTSHPDYDAAAQHLAQARARELGRYGLQPHEIHAALAEEVLEITRSAINMGKSPAELAYEIAQDRGYRPGHAEQQGEHPMLAAIAKGQQQRSFGNGRAAAAATDPNLNAIANMSEAEFDRMYKTDPQFRALADRLG